MSNIIEAISRLNPTNNRFCTTNPSEHAVQCEPFVLICDYCEAQSHPDDTLVHLSDCPVTKLREVVAND